MIALEDRQALVQDIGAAQSGGARLSKACEVCGIDRRTLHRWKADAIAPQSGDRRPMREFTSQVNRPLAECWAPRVRTLTVVAPSDDSRR